MDTKVLVATKYLEHNARLGGLRPVLTEVAVECRVGRDFEAKIERELMENNGVLPPEEIFMDRDHPIGPGLMSMSGESKSYGEGEYRFGGLVVGGAHGARSFPSCSSAGV